MTRNESPRWRPTPTTVIAGTLVIAGFSLSGVSWWFFLLAAVGALGPGLARELGWLRDKDEFQRRADHRAGYHAFLVAGVLAFVLVAFYRSADRAVEHTERLPTLFLALLWFTWLLSSLIAYWGPRRAAVWILRIAGTVVLAFTILSNVGAEWTGWSALLLHPLLAAPFFVLAWLAARWPRAGGVLLVAVSAVLLSLGFGNDHLAWITRAVTAVWFVGPLLAGGVALLFAEREDEEDLETA